MGLVEDGEQKQPPLVIKHYCRVCNRGFTCAGALGGHMRTHAVGSAERFHPNEDKGLSYIVRNKAEGATKHSYFLRTNTNKIIHHRSSGDADPDIPARPHDERAKCTLDDCFSRPYAQSRDDGVTIKRAEIENRDDRNCSASREEEDLANCLVMLSNKSFINKEHNDKISDETDKGMFQCKACKKFFSSHQALGGHRASHKKVKGCYATKTTNLNEDDSFEEDLINQEENLMGSSYSTEPGFAHLDLLFENRIRQSRVTKSKSRDHQCSICQRVFTSGQALGGHKRCHWLTTGNLPDATLIQNLRDQFHFDSPTEIFKKPMPRKTNDPQTLDLNFPPLVDPNMNSSPSPVDYEAPARVFLQLWGNNESNVQQQQHGESMHETLHGFNDVEEECRMKKVKLSELKDMNLDGGSSRWLQVGIASTADM